MANDDGAQPGWYADPIGRFDLRFFNGAGWTADVSDGGARFVDPHGIKPGPSRSPQPTASDSSNSAANAAMTLGIISVAIAWLPFLVVFGVIAAVLALGLGWVGLRRSSESGAGHSRAIVGIITGASGLVAGVLGVVLTIVVLGVYDRYVDPAPHEVAVQQCTLSGARATATGTLTNLGDETSDFSVVIGFARGGTDNPQRTARAVLDDVEPGVPATFELERQVDLDDVSCVVVEVTGPLPFGLELD